MSNIITVPFSKLVRDERNVRKHGRDTNIEALAASILAQGVLQNLVAYRVEGTDTYAVVAGGRRFDAIAMLVQRDYKPADWPVTINLISEAEATAASLTENVQREAMHPADEFDAFTKLTAENWTIDQIADAFGVTPLVVERRLKLAKAAPELIERFRANELTTDQMIALCATDDHAVQLAVWERLGHNNWNNKPADLRRAVLAEDVQADRDPRVAFLGGIKPYQDAGGEVRRDLFSQDGKGAILTNPALLDKLVADKLEAEAESLRAEGWGWVEVWTEMDYSALHRLGRIEPEATNLSEAAQSEIAALEAERQALFEEQESLHGRAEDEDRELTDDEWQRDNDIDDRLEQIQAAIALIEDKSATFPPEVMQAAGALVIFDQGNLRIERGRVRAADRQAVAAATGNDRAVKGGRETEAAGRKTDAVSDALRRSLLGHRNLAVQTEVAKQVKVAKVLLAITMIERIESVVKFGHPGAGVPSDLVIGREGYGGTRTGYPITDETGEAKLKAFRASCAAVVDALPTDEAKRWDALAEMKPAELDKIIAVGVALSVSLSTEHNHLTAKLLDALGFDMAAHFETTAETYLGRVPKPLIVEALAEAGKIKDDADRTALLAMKKGALAAEAETRLAGTGWVPKGIRTPKPKKPAAPKAAKQAPAKATAKPKAPAKSKPLPAQAAA